MRNYDLSEKIYTMIGKISLTLIGVCAKICPRGNATIGLVAGGKYLHLQYNTYVRGFLCVACVKSMRY